MELQNSSASTKFRCIVCGLMWGSGEDIGSSGLCINCLATWVIKKQESEGKTPCFGDNVCSDADLCRFNKFCKEYYDAVQ